MSCSLRDVITRLLGCDPVVTDTSRLSEQHQARFYWGNIAFVEDCATWEQCESGSLSDTRHEKKGCDLKNKANDHTVSLSSSTRSVITREKPCKVHGWNKTWREQLKSKLSSISAASDKCGIPLGKDMTYTMEMDENADTLWITELEVIFSPPIHYTDTGNLQISANNFWAELGVCLQRNILQPLTFHFKCEKKKYGNQRKRPHN